MPQRLARHPAQRQIIVLLPVFRKQFDEGQQVDGGFKDQQLLVGATVGKAKRLFCTGCIYGITMSSTMRLSNSSTFRHIFSLMLPLDKLMFL